MSDSNAPIPTPDASDDLLARCLGRDLQTATLRSAVYLLVAAALFATVGALIH